jgi:hypothetical protein
MARAAVAWGVSAVMLAASAACGGSGSTPYEAAASPPSAPFTPTECGTYSGRGCAPASERVDLRRPAFSRPTSITNPLFPISRLRSALLLGHVDGKPFRSETTLLPGTSAVVWDGRRIGVLVSQYMAYLDGRLEEVALDRYAQADDGSVWYLGEDVFDYRHGTVAFTEGTWLAGRDGPAAMIMPAKPTLGDVFRTENVPGIVFEEVRVSSVGRTVAGPRGPVVGAIVSSELHADGTSEDKIFAPGYGEFSTSGGGDLEALALAVPTDALAGPVPPALAHISTSAAGILESTRLGDWEAVSATMRRLDASWRAIRAGHPPPRVAAVMKGAVDALTRAVHARRPGGSAQAAIDVMRSALDLQLRYRPPAEIDAARFDLWTQQLRVDAAANDLPGVTGDVAVLEWIRDRIPTTLDAASLRELDTRLRGLRAAADAKNLAAAADHAARLAVRLRELRGR